MSSTSAQTSTEREQLVAALEKSEQRWLDVMQSVPERAASVKLNEEGWSIAELAEHVAYAEHGMFRAIELSGAKTTPTDFSLDEKILKGGTNRTVKINAPERAHPKGRWKTLPECIEAFRQSRLRALEFAKVAEGLRGKLIEHPAFGPIDGHQCILIMAIHAERHALQVEEIKNSAAYKAVAG